MSAADQIKVGADWCLRSEELPHGTLEQVRAWLLADPRPGLVVRVVKAPEPEIRDVWFVVSDGSTFRLPDMEFTARYQPVRGQRPRPVQVPPERPPASYDELIQRRLVGW